MKLMYRKELSFKLKFEVVIKNIKLDILKL